MSKYIESLLYKYPGMQSEIQQLSEELHQMILQKDELYSGLRAAAPGDTPVQHGISDPTYQIFEKVIIKYNATLQEIQERMADCVSRKNYISKQLGLLSQQEYLIIDLRCFQGLHWEVVARKSHYHRSHCFRIYHQAIQKMSRDLLDYQAQHETQ